MSLINKRKIFITILIRRFLSNETTINKSLNENNLCNQFKSTNGSKENSHQKYVTRIQTDNSFWKSEWNKRSLGFHKEERHHMLLKHHQILFGNKQKCKVFFPLCGKAVDMAWFASMGHQIIGVDLVQTAFEEFFNEHKIEYTVKENGDFKVYESKDGSIKLYLGDFFKFSNKYEGLFDSVWDRGSLVAIQPSDRERYAELMLSLLAPDCNYLLDTFDYDPTEWPGPPHYVSEELVYKLYGRNTIISKIDNAPAKMSDRQKLTMSYFEERVHLIKPK